MYFIFIQPYLASSVFGKKKKNCKVIALFSIQEGQIDIFCDNMEALRRRPPHLNSYTRLSRRDIDIKMELEAIISTLPVDVTLQHVPGHADEHPDFIYDNAPQHVRRNIDMHNGVTEFMDNTPAHLVPRSEAPFYPEQKIALFLRGHIIVDDMIEEVLLHEHGSIMESRMTRKMQIDSSIQHVINWEAFQQAFKKLNLNEKSTTTKIVHQMWPTQTVLNDRKRGVRALCLRCKNCDEDFDHVFQCRQVGSMSAFRNAINSFSKELTKFKTAKPIQNALISIVVAYQQCTIPVPPPHALGRPTKLSMTLQTVFKHQMLLGSHSLSMGYLSYKWSYLHNMYTKASDPEKCKDESIPNINWSSKIIAALWRFSSSVWRSRCKAIHIKDKNKDESLCVEELRQSIRAYLRLSRRCLSSDEKTLHINVVRHMKKAYPTTLARWLRLLSTERELTIRKKREERIRKGGLQPLTKFFRKKRSP